MENRIPTFDEAMEKYVPSFDEAMNQPVFKSRPRFVSSGFDIDVYGPQDVWAAPLPDKYFKSTNALIGELPQTAGGETGELIGGSVGAAFGPAGHLTGRVIGSALGGGIGVNIQQDIKEKLGAEKMTDWQRAKMTGRAMLEESGAVGLGEAAARGLKWAAAPFRKKLIKEAPEMMGLAQKYGTHLTPGQLTDAWAADTLETIADASFFGGRRMKSLKLRQQPQAIAKYAEDLADEFTKRMNKQLDPDSIGRYVDDVLSGRKRQFRMQAEALYGNLDNLSQGVTVDISPLKKFAKENLTEAEKFAGIGATEAGDNLLRKVAEVGPDDKAQLTFREARKLKTRLMREEDIGLSKKFTQMLDTAMEKAAKEEGGDLYTAWRDINDFYRKGAETYNNKIIEGMVKTIQDKGEPEKVIPYVFKNKSVSRIKTVKKALGGSESKSWRMLKAKYVENLLDVKPGKLMGSNIPNDFHNMGEQALKEIFHKDELDALTKIGQWSNLVSGRASREMATGGSMVVQLVQGGAVLSVLSGKFTDIATPVFVLPEVISQLASRPSTAKWLSRGFDIPAGTSEGMALSNRLLLAVRRAKLVNERDYGKKLSPVFPTKPVSGHHF